MVATKLAEESRTTRQRKKLFGGLMARLKRGQTIRIYPDNQGIRPRDRLAGLCFFYHPVSPRKEMNPSFPHFPLDIPPKIM